jgi:uncharacterized membrane protein
MTTAQSSPDLSKPLARSVFLLFWLIAIALWIVAGVVFTNTATGGFLADIGVVVASIGLSAPFISQRGFRSALIFGLIAIALSAIGQYLDIPVFVYFVRAFVPFLALMTPMYKVLNGIRIFA